VDILDEPGFLQERVNLALGHEHFDVGDFGDQLLLLGAEVRRRLKVLEDPAPEVGGLADVEDPPPVVLHQVHARRLGERANLLDQSIALQTSLLARGAAAGA
jgi:hypothetical protein